jgi:hypothetical protein
MIMKKLSWIAFVGVAIVLATASFSQAAAAAHGGHGFSGHPGTGQFDRPRGFEGHRAFEGRRDFDRRPDAFIGVPFSPAPVYPDYYSPDYADAPPAPTYWYYCPSYGAYYPTVPSCPDAWVPVASQ